MRSSNHKNYKVICKRIHNVFTLSSFNTNIYIHIVRCYECRTYYSFRSLILTHMCSASRTLNHSCSAIYNMAQSSESNANLVLQIYSGQKLSYQKSITHKQQKLNTKKYVH